MFNFTEPPADIRVAATTMFQIYTALLQAGFTEPQAMQLLGQMVAASAGGSAQK